MSNKMHKNLKQEQPQIPQIDLSLAESIQCNSCGNHTFVPVVLLKKFSDITSPTGKGGYLPIPTYACNACGFVNSDLLPKVE